MFRKFVIAAATTAAIATAGFTPAVATQAQAPVAPGPKGWHRLPASAMSARDKTLVACLAFRGLGRAGDNMTPAAKRAAFGKVIHLPNGAVAHPYNFALTVKAVRTCSARGNCRRQNKVVGVSVDNRWRGVARPCLKAWGVRFHD